jgi:hypothetical protein
MAAIAGIPPGNESQIVQLFTRDGNAAVEVSIPPGVTVVTWQGRFFRLSEGRFVESQAFATTSAFDIAQVSG